MLTLQNICVRFESTATLERPALAIADLKLPNCACTAIIGSNGAGKSTLFKVIGGQIKPSGGCVTLSDKDCAQLSARERARTFATVVQDPRQGTFEQLSIYENMAFAAARGAPNNARSIFSRSQKKLFAERLAILDMGLEDRLSAAVASLSGGQRQALSLVMATLTTPKVLLLDEPTAALDPQMATRVMDLVQTLTQQLALTTLMITHNLEHAAQYATNILVMHSGTIVKAIKSSKKSRLSPLDLAQCLHENTGNRASRAA